MRVRDPLTAAVGISGGWFDWKRGRMRRVKDDQLREDAVPLDHVAGNQLPFFLVGAVRRVGVFCEELFFGFSELEFGLRLWTTGSTLYGYGPLWLESREQTGRVNLELRPSRRLHPVSWRDYYTPSERDLHPAAVRASEDRTAGHARARLRETRRPTS